jgi:dihydrofolate reductase
MPRTYLKAGLVDEVRVSMVPVLFGAGTRLFDDIGTERIELEYAGLVESKGVVHLRLGVAGH